jgi:hypothetical protein
MQALYSRVSISWRLRHGHQRRNICCSGGWENGLRAQAARGSAGDGATMIVRTGSSRKFRSLHSAPPTLGKEEKGNGQRDGI